MKILWITNSTFPEANALLSGNGDFKGSGGWMLGAANSLLKNPEIELFVASVSDLVTDLKELHGERIVYFLFPKGKGNIRYNGDYEPYFKKISESVSPDVVHIHGTEFTHSLAFVRACGNSNVVVSIQGLKWVYYRYYLGGLSFWDVIKNITLHDILKGSIYTGKREYKLTGKCEKELIKSVKYAIGRTDWDKAHVWSVNPDCQYYFGNETLRDEFYESKKWNYENCEKHSVWVKLNRPCFLQNH